MTSRLQEFAQGPPFQPRARADEQCELCAEPIAAEHRHLLDLEARRPLCVCRACSILFDRSGAGGARYRLIPDRVRLVTDLALDDLLWQSLDIPVETAFFFHSSSARRVVAFYPSPMGATESLLDLQAWDDLARSNPVLSELEPDVEALLVNRSKDEHWLLPVDRCYELVGMIRTHWKGFQGGSEVWDALEAFYEDLRRQAKAVTKEGREARWESESASPT